MLHCISSKLCKQVHRNICWMHISCFVPPRCQLINYEIYHKYSTSKLTMQISVSSTTSSTFHRMNTKSVFFKSSQQNSSVLNVFENWLKDPNLLCGIKHTLLPIKLTTFHTSSNFPKRFTHNTLVVFLKSNIVKAVYELTKTTHQYCIS